MNRFNVPVTLTDRNVRRQARFLDLTDAELVAKACGGNEKALGILINRHYPACVRLATFILHDRGDAQDEVQNAFCKAFQHLDQFHGDSGFLGWLLRIVSNQCLMLIRSKGRARFVYLDGNRGGEELQSPGPDPEREAMEDEMKHVLKTEIRCIPPLFRDVLVLRDVQELPISNVAERLRITVPAAKSRLQRARTELRQRVLKHSTTPHPATGRIAAVGDASRVMRRTTEECRSSL